MAIPATSAESLTRKLSPSHFDVKLDVKHYVACRTKWGGGGGGGG